MKTDKKILIPDFKILALFMFRSFSYDAYLWMMQPTLLSRMHVEKHVNRGTDKKTM